MKEKFIPAFDFPFLTKMFDAFLTFTIPEKRIKGDLIGLMNIGEGDAILDFGCGTGTLLMLGKQKHPKAHFEGIDIDPQILAIAGNKIKKQRLDIVLTEYDGGTLPYEDNSVKKVMTSLMMHHLSTDKKLKAMREIFRILSPGGQLFLSDFGKQRNPVFALIGAIAAKFSEEVAANFKGLLPDLMQRAGFRNVRTLKRYETGLGTIYIYSGDK